MGEILTPPQHVQNAELHLRIFANGIAAHFDAPVWLVGSSLHDLNTNPRDWDVRVTLPDEDFERRYNISASQWADEGIDGQWTPERWAWAKDCTKRTHEAWKITGLNIDFQVHPETQIRKWGFNRLPRYRLDTKPELEVKP